MSWISDLASGLGIPAGAATLAVAMYGACVAAERAASKEALKDIGGILKDTSWEPSVRPSAIIERVFVWTFGEQHLSWKCLRRSMLATFAFVMALWIVYLEMTGESPVQLFRPITHYFSSTGLIDLAWIMLVMLVCTVLPDYISLFKARLLLRILDNTRNAVATGFVVLADFVGSALISLCVNIILVSSIYHTVFHELSVGDLLYGGSIEVMETISSMFGAERPTFMPGFISVAFFSTLFTSIWAILIMLSSTFLKLLAPIQRFTGWFFDVDKHPVQAIGIVAGALVMIGSLIWTVLRAVI